MLTVRRWEPVSIDLGDGDPITLQLKRFPWHEAKGFLVRMNLVRREDVRAGIAEMRQLDAAVSSQTLARYSRAIIDAGLERPALGDDEDAVVALAGVLLRAGLPLPTPSYEEERATRAQRLEIRDRISTALEALHDSLDTDWVRSVFVERVKDVGGVSVDGERVTTGEQLFEVADGPLVLRILDEFESLCRLPAAAKNDSSSRSTSAPVAPMADGPSRVAPAEREDGPDLATVMDRQGGEPSSRPDED